VAHADKFRGLFFAFASSWTKVAQGDKLKGRQCILLFILFSNKSKSVIFALVALRKAASAELHNGVQSTHGRDYTHTHHLDAHRALQVRNAARTVQGWSIDVHGIYVLCRGAFVVVVNGAYELSWTVARTTLLAAAAAFKSSATLASK